MKMYVVVTRHTSEYCGEDQPFEIDFANMQFIDKPEIVNLPIEKVLRLVLRKYYGVKTTESLIAAVEEGVAEVGDTTLIKEMNGKLERYTLTQTINGMTIQCEDRNLTIQSYPLIMAEIFEM